MRDLLKSKNFKILLIAIFVVLGVMLYSASTSGQQNFITSITSFITSPIQRLSAVVAGGANDFGDNFTDIEVIRAQNDILVKKVRELQSQMVDYEEIKQENERLRGAVELQQENPDFNFASATVISRDSTDSYYSFIIDRGSKHGIEYLDPVITEDGLVGYISQVGPISSRVTTILSPATDVGAIDRRTRDGGVLGGDLEMAKNGYTKLSYLARDCDVTAGDIVVTSGLGSIYPKNLIIGEVMEICAEAQDISLYAIIKPYADISECTDVFVITSFNGQHAVVNGELSELEVSGSDAGDKAEDKKDTDGTAITTAAVDPTATTTAPQTAVTTTTTTTTAATTTTMRTFADE